MRTIIGIIGLITFAAIMGLVGLVVGDYLYIVLSLPPDAFLPLRWLSAVVFAGVTVGLALLVRRWSEKYPLPARYPDSYPYQGKPVLPLASRPPPPAPDEEDIEGVAR